MKKLLMALILVLMASVAMAATVTVGWSPSTSEDVTAYRVYKATASGAHEIGRGAVVETVVLEATIDVAADVGGVVYFVVTAVNSAGLESNPSNELVIDLSTGEWIRPNPPGNLRVVAIDTGM